MIYCFSFVTFSPPGGVFQFWCFPLQIPQCLGWLSAPSTDPRSSEQYSCNTKLTWVFPLQTPLFNHHSLLAYIMYVCMCVCVLFFFFFSNCFSPWLLAAQIKSQSCSHVAPFTLCHMLGIERPRITAQLHMWPFLFCSEIGRLLFEPLMQLFFTSSLFFKVSFLSLIVLQLYNCCKLTENTQQCLTCGPGAFVIDPVINAEI